MSLLEKPPLSGKEEDLVIDAIKKSRANLV